MGGAPAFIASASAVAWFAGFVLVHIAGWRSGRDNARWLVRSYALSLAGMVATVIGIVAGSHALGPCIMAMLIALLTSACLFVLYVPAVYVVLTSMSVQTVLFLRRHGGERSEAELYAHFASRAVLEGRLATLVASGYLAGEGGRFRLTPSGRAIARTFASVKALWKLGPGG